MKKTDLEKAIREILWDDAMVDALLESTAFPIVLRFAGEKAFLEELTGPAVDTVREALKRLSNPGTFDFEPED